MNRIINSNTKTNGAVVENEQDNQQQCKTNGAAVENEQGVEQPNSNDVTEQRRNRTREYLDQSCYALSSLIKYQTTN